MKQNAITRKSYADASGNVYRVEQASNKSFVCVRVNSSGNRKGVKTMGAHKRAEQAQFELDANAQRNGWQEVK